MTETTPATDQRRPRGPTALIALAVFGLLLFAGFIALGTWQVHRLSWKLDLIARVNQRVNAAPVIPPGPAQWSEVTVASDEYRHVTVTGNWLSDRSTRVRASTDAFGSGFWLITPLRRADGSIVLINRGFVAPDNCTNTKPCAPDTDGDVTVTVTGLVRITEPRGGFLTTNDPTHDNWYSRDVQAIAKARGLSDVAPYFIDADRVGTNNNPHIAPVGGLTVISFPNNHLQYAITWYILALMVLVGAWLVWRDVDRQRKS